MGKTSGPPPSQKKTPWFPVEFSLVNPWILSQAFASLAFRAQRVTPKRRRVEWSSDVKLSGDVFFRIKVAGFDHEKLDLKNAHGNLTNQKSSAATRGLTKMGIRLENMDAHCVMIWHLAHLA